MKLLLAILLLPAARADAFLFGRSSDAKAVSRLAEMRAAYNGGDCAAALALSDPFLKENPPSDLRREAYVYMGSCYESSGSADKAINLYKLAIGLYPDNMLFSSRLALIYNQTGFPADAVPLFLKVISRLGDDLESNLGLARAYSSLGFLSRASEFYSRVVALQNFGDLATLEEYERCLLRKRDWTEALFIAGKGKAAAPRSAFWPLAEARISAGRGDYYKALESMDRALRYAPDRQLRLERALYLLLGGLPRRAIEAADAELKLDPSDALAAEVKGMALYSLGDKAGAAPYFSTALGGGPFAAKVAGSFLANGRPKPEEACKK